jgi:hypothetical protein
MFRPPRVEITHCKRCGKAIVTSVKTNAPQTRARWGSICECCMTEDERWQMNVEIGRELAERHKP